MSKVSIVLAIARAAAMTSPLYVDIENGAEVYVLSIYNLTNTSMDLRFDYNLDLNGTLFPIPANIRFVSNP